MRAVLAREAWPRHSSASGDNKEEIVLFREALPDFHVEVEGLLRARGRDDLIQQLPILELVR
jgi:hypothetical protein